MKYSRFTAGLLLVLAASLSAVPHANADYQFDDLMGPSGISYQWMVLNDNGDTFGGSHKISADVSGDILSNNDAVLNVLSGTSATEISDRSLNTFFLVVADGQGEFTMNFRVPDLSQQFNVATPNLSISTPWDADTTQRELYVDTKSPLALPLGGDYDDLWRGYNFQIRRADGNATPYNTTAQYFYFQQNTAYSPSQGIPRPFIIANVGSGTAYDDPAASLKLKLILRDSSAANANIAAYDQFTWDMTGPKNAMGSQWVFVPVDSWPVDNTRINYYLTTEVANRCSVRYAAYNGTSNTWLYPNYWKFNLLRLHGSPKIRETFALAPESHIAPGLVSVYKRQYNVNETDKIPLRLFPVDDPSGIGVYNLVMNHTIIYGTKIGDTYKLPASEGNFNQIEITAYEPHPASLNFYDNIARLTAKITGYMKAVKAPSSSLSSLTSSITRENMPSRVLQNFTVNQNIPASLRTASTEGILPMHVTFNIPLTAVGSDTWNTLLKELDRQENSAYIGDVFADYFNLFAMAEGGNVWNLTQELQEKGAYEGQIKVYLDTERGKTTQDTDRGVLTVSFIVMLMDGSIDGERPALRIVPDVSNDGSTEFNAEYMVIRDGKEDGKWKMTFFVAPRDYTVNPDAEVKGETSGTSGSSGGGGGCTAGAGTLWLMVAVVAVLAGRHVRRVTAMVLAVTVLVWAGTAFAATDVTYQATYRIGTDVDTISDAIADALEHYDDEDDEDPESFSVIKIILTEDITEEDLGDIPFDDADSGFTRITLQGANRSITITPSDTVRHFTLNNSSLTLGLENLTVAGNEDGGGGIVVEAGTLDARGVTFAGNDATALDAEEDDDGNTVYPNGGAVQVEGSGTAIFTECAFTGNRSANGGAVYVASGASVTFSEGTTFTGNRAEVSGGAVYFENAGGAEITGARFGNGTEAGQNSAPLGGAVAVSTGVLVLSSTEFAVNSADIGGGAVYAEGTLSLGDGLTFSGNKAVNGGAVCISGDGNVSANTSVVTFSRNSATNGGAVYSALGSAINLLTYADFISNTAVNGGAVYIAGESSQGTFVLDSTRHYTFSGNTAAREGGAVYTLNANVLLDGLMVDGASNSAGTGGGFLRSGGSATIRTSTIAGQRARFGGAVYSVGDVTITDSEFSGNTAETNTADYPGGGGAIYVEGSLTVSSSDFTENLSISPLDGHGGGAIFVSGDAEIDGSRFTSNMHTNSQNVPNGGGAVRSAYGLLKVTDSVFTGNQASGGTASQGGAVYTYKTAVNITNCLFRSNKAVGNGGALTLMDETNSTITSCTFTDNSTSGGYGGVIYAQGNLALSASYFAENRAYADGGAVYFNQHNKTGFGTFEAKTCLFSQNSAGISPSQYGRGGAMFLQPDAATINSCTFDTNISSTSNGTSGGGGVYLDTSDGTSAVVTAVKNSVFFGNQVTGGATNYGAGLYTKGDCSVSSCSFTGNQAVGSSTRGGGLYVDTGTVTVTANIFVGNIAEIGRDVYAEGTITSRGYNRVGVYGKGGSDTSWLADVIGSGTDRENSSWTTVTFFGENAELTYTEGTTPVVGSTLYEDTVYLIALPLNELESLAEADRATNIIPYARRYTLNIEQYDIWGTDRFASGNDISIGAMYFGGKGNSGDTSEEGVYDIASITMSGIPNTLKYPGQTASLIAMVRYTNGRVAYGVPYDTTSITQNQQERVNWSSSNASAVKVDKYGNITALRETSNSNGVVITVSTVRNTLAGSPATASNRIIVINNNGYEYMNISPEYYTYLTQSVLPQIFEYDISAAIADKNPSTVRSATFQRNFAAVWSATPEQITDLTTSTPTIAASTSSPAVSGMRAAKRAGVSINYQNRETGELFPMTYSWTLTGEEIAAVLGYDLSGRKVSAALAEEVFSEYRVECQGNSGVISVLGAGGVSGSDAYDYGALELTKADGDKGLHVALTVYLGDLGVTGYADGAQIVRGAGTARVLVVPDGAADGAIAGSVWMFRPAGTDGGTDTTPGTDSGTTPGTSSNSGGGGGGGGCNAAGLGILAVTALFLKRKH